MPSAFVLKSKKNTVYCCLYFANIVVPQKQHIRPIFTEFWTCNIRRRTQRQSKCQCSLLQHTVTESTEHQSVDNNVHATEISQRFSLFCYYCGMFASNQARECYIFTQIIMHMEVVSISVLTTDRYLSQNTINLFSPIWLSKNSALYRIANLYQNPQIY